MGADCYHHDQASHHEERHLFPPHGGHQLLLGSQNYWQQEIALMVLTEQHLNILQGQQKKGQIL